MEDAKPGDQSVREAAGDGDACAPTSTGGVTVYFDGSCPLCQREIALAQRLTGEDAVAYQDISTLGAGDALAADLDVAAAMARFHVRGADGALKNGAAAFLEMWTRSPRLRFLKPIARSRSAVRALDAVYAQFLKVRPHLSGAVRRYDAWRAARRPR